MKTDRRGYFALFAATRPPAAELLKRSRVHAELGTDGVLEILIYGDIVDSVTLGYLEMWGYDVTGFVSAVGVKKALDGAANCTKIRMRINSPGGDAFEGMAIHSLLTSQAKPVEAYIDGIAASSASIIAMGAGTRIMGQTAMMMIHNAWADCTGYASDMRKMADVLDKIGESIASCYVNRTGMDAGAIQGLMDAETWMSAQDCVEQGFATAIAELPTTGEVKAMAAARRFKALALLRNVPAQLKAAAACACDCDNCVDGDCGECTNKDCADENCVDCPMQAGAENRVDLPQAVTPAASGDEPARDEMEFARARHRARSMSVIV